MNYMNIPLLLSLRLKNKDKSEKVFSIIVYHLQYQYSMSIELKCYKMNKFGSRPRF